MEIAEHGTSGPSLKKESTAAVLSKKRLFERCFRVRDEVSNSYTGLPAMPP